MFVSAKGNKSTGHSYPYVMCCYMFLSRLYGNCLFAKLLIYVSYILQVGLAGISRVSSNSVLKHDVFFCNARKILNMEELNCPFMKIDTKLVGPKGLVSLISVGSLIQNET